jgi:uncharacterized protein involved in exopolysaccharide biosynthesis
MVTFKRITGAPAAELDRPETVAPQRAQPGADGWPTAGNGAADGLRVNGSPVEPEERSQRIFEPPSGVAVRAITRHKLLVCVCTLACAVAGVALGVAHRRTFTSSATLQVGQVNPNSPGFYGYVQSAAALATAFSRAIDAEPVLRAIHDRLALAPTTAIERLSAEPLPSSPAFRVIATGPSRADAVSLANVASSAIIAYEQQSNSANPAAASLLREYHHASLALQRTTARIARLRGGKHALAPAALQVAEVARSTDAVRLRAIENAYTAAVTSQAPRSGLVSLLAGATGASSDHKSKIELYGLAGLLAGLVAGCLAAVARERRSERHTIQVRMRDDTPRPEPA